MKRIAMAATCAVAAALLTAGTSGCSSGKGEKPSATPTHATKASTAAPSGTPKGPATVSLGSSKYGKILTDAKGRTLYLFEADKSKKSTCTGTCAAAWPPLTTAGEPHAGKGIKAGLLGSTKRSDGTTEVTYNNHPLYYYAGDKKPGDTNGQELNQFGAEWYVLTASGKKTEG
ncbi:hypothetical protein ABT381_03760 [Streptomyces sp. NPDC000151]|uniref:COG4315 family predicted lipoprotein n=1 Tax=Streptomyces sp. NPDC000151 TaxID=3154244 RepID=UPI00331C2076